MRELIDLEDFLGKNWKGFPEHGKVIEIADSDIPGVVMKNGKIFLSPYTPEVDFVYHQGIFMGFDHDLNPEFNNLENLRRGYFGDPDGYTYLSSDLDVKASECLTDLYLKIDYKKLNQPLYRDPETFTVKYNYEWDRAFMMKGAIPKPAIMEVTFPENIRLIRELRHVAENLPDWIQCFERTKQIREEFLGLCGG